MSKPIARGDDLVLTVGDPLTLDADHPTLRGVDDPVSLIELACQRAVHAGPIPAALAVSWKIPELAGFSIELRNAEVPPAAVQSVCSASVLLLRGQLPTVPPPARHWYVGFHGGGLWEAH